MANQTRTTTPKIKDSNPLEDAALKVQAGYESNKKRVNTIITVVLFLVVAVLAYYKLYKGPRENKAAAAAQYAQDYFAKDSLNAALNGDGQHLGFLKIMKKYSGTRVANLCNYYAGV